MRNVCITTHARTQTHTDTHNILNAWYSAIDLLHHSLTYLIQNTKHDKEMQPRELTRENQHTERKETLNFLIIKSMF
jgi:hypothetical protein